MPTMSNEPSTSTNARGLLAALTALRNGDFSMRLSDTGASGTENAEIVRVFNELGEMLSIYGAEIRRVSRELGTEGRFGPQAEVAGVQGEWETMLVEFNRMAANLTNQVRNFATVTTAIATGDLAAKVTVEVDGEMLEWKQTINIMIDQLNAFMGELTRLCREVGNEGKLGGQMEVRGTSGSWKDLIDNVNHMSSNLTTSLRGLSRYCDALAAGDASSTGTLAALPTRGEFAQLCDLVEKIRARLPA